MTTSKYSNCYKSYQTLKNSQIKATQYDDKIMLFGCMNFDQGQGQIEQSMMSE